MVPGGALERLFARLRAHGGRDAVIEGDRAHSYADLLAAAAAWEGRLAARGVAPGAVVALRSDFGFEAIALMLALFRRGCVVAFLSPNASDPGGALADARATALFSAGPGGLAHSAVEPGREAHPLIEQLRAEGRPGFIIFSSGSSARPKAILHDLERFLTSYATAAKALVTLAFLLFDHVAGLDTLFYTLHAGGTLVLTPSRSPEAVCALVERRRVEVLPVSPSFLKLLCVSGAADGRDLASLRIITFGSEPMPRATLERVAAMFPRVSLRQKYGASEFGAPRARTRAGDGLWIRLGEGADTRVEDGLLWIRSIATMVGYLNADPPPRRGEWLCTGDRVDTDGEWVRILGRQSDLINVGGQKVQPSEVEGVIEELDCVAQASVSGAPHALLGQIVTAVVLPREHDADPADVRKAILGHCLRRLERHKVPAKIAWATEALTTERQKVKRASLAGRAA